MNSPQLAGAGQAAQSTLMRIADRIKNLTECAMTLNSKMSGFRYRVLGNQDDAEVATDAPEPVRNEVEELDHRINNLEFQLAEAERQFSDVDSL